MKGKTAYIGLSGGVDSSVSAALLKERGFDVTGVFIKVWQPDWMECSWREDRLDAMRVCAKLGIPCITLDLEEAYKREVVDYMIREYKAGRTPNPDVMCNRHVKFGGFFDWALSQGADVVATGHYARIERTPAGTHRLCAGRDEGKDQSYFLWTLTERELSRTVFPVGDMEKAEVRKLAKKFDLPTATKKDSQGLCFIGSVDMKEFLSHYIERSLGDVLDMSGKKIGTHDGAVFLTCGERHGFTVFNEYVDGTPYYVVARDVIKNTITVSHDFNAPELQQEKGISIENTIWREEPRVGAVYTARIRHLGTRMACRVESIIGTTAYIQFDVPTYVASGQSIVVYEGETCLGGGIVS